jgi:hypothetical protein
MKPRRWRSDVRRRFGIVCRAETAIVLPVHMDRQRQLIFGSKIFLAMMLAFLEMGIFGFSAFASEPIQFGKPVYLNSLPDPGFVVRSAAVADLNGDGNQDLVVGFSSPHFSISPSNILAVVLGRGNGVFGTPVKFRSPVTTDSSAGASAIKISDVNGDGVLDIVSADIGAVTFLRGNGDGIFAPPIHLYPRPVSFDPFVPFSILTDVEIGDFNRDGKRDILAFSENAGFGPTKLILFAQENDVFTRSEFLLGLDEGPHFSYAAKGDFNRDGKLDMIVQSSSRFDGGLLRVYLGMGDGAFQGGFSLTNLEADNVYVVRMTVGDVNHDNLPDVVVVKMEVPNVFSSRDSISVFLGRGDGTFSREISNPFLASTYCSSFVIEDFDNDGNLDAVLAFYDGTISILLGRGDGHFQDRIEIFKGDFFRPTIVAGDFNHDGRVDLFLSGDKTGDKNGLSNGEYGVSVSCVFLNGVTNESTIRSGDILWQNADGRLAFWLMNKTNVLESVEVNGTNLNSLGRALAVNDFNHDGQSDILFQQPDGRFVIGFLNGATVTRTESLTAANAVPRGWKFVGLADFNNDGKKDLLWNTGQGLIAWMLDGTRIIGERSIETGPIFPNAQLLGTADFNHDGSTDLLWLNNGAVTVSFLSRGDYRYSVYLNGGKRVSRGWKVGGTGDLNGDGWPDILWRHDDGRLVAWLLNGTRIVEFVPLRPDRPVSPGWRIVGID